MRRGTAGLPQRPDPPGGLGARSAAALGCLAPLALRRQANDALVGRRYAALLSLALEHPLAVLSAEEGWGRRVSFPIVETLLHSAGVILQPAHPLAAAYELYRVGYLVLGLCLLVGLLRRRWYDYGLWAAATLRLPLSSGNLVSIHRFVWAIFPFFFLVGDWGGRHPRLFAGAVGAMAVLQAAVLAAFVNAPALPFPLLS